MTEAELRVAMEAAVAREDFAEAARLRDRISLLRGGATGDVDATGLDRQQTGKMGLGSSQQKLMPPSGWVPPPKPDPMTRGRSRPRRRD